MAPTKVEYTLTRLLGRLIAQRGDAIHLHEGEPPVFEIKRVLCKIEGPNLAHGDTYALLAIAASEDDLLEFQNNGLVCFYHRFQQSSVFQFMAFREDKHVRLEIRKFK
jgi:Tfp pilus assembly ATPase PilU